MPVPAYVLCWPWAGVARVPVPVPVSAGRRGWDSIFGGRAGEPGRMESCSPFFCTRERGVDGESWRGRAEREGEVFEEACAESAEGKIMRSERCQAFCQLALVPVASRLGDNKEWGSGLGFSWAWHGIGAQGFVEGVFAHSKGS